MRILQLQAGTRSASPRSRRVWWASWTLKLTRRTLQIQRHGPAPVPSSTEGRGRCTSHLQARRCRSQLHLSLGSTGERDILRRALLSRPTSQLSLAVFFVVGGPSVARSSNDCSGHGYVATSNEGLRIGNAASGLPARR
jgi:hypothetical protein